MPVVVQPESFSLVLFDAGEIRELVERLVHDIGLPDDLDISITIDETTPLGAARLESIVPVVISLESGALEDARRPRQLDPRGATDVIGRLLFEVRDRLDPAFGEVPGSADLSLPLSSAWQTYCVGRLSRLGHRVQRQRRLYAFRNRHGFTDAADAAFDRLWSGEDLAWADIAAASDSAGAAR